MVPSLPSIFPPYPHSLPITSLSSSPPLSPPSSPVLYLLLSPHTTNTLPTGNAGLGKQTILNLAAHNPSRIYLAARTATKAESAIKEIRAAVPQCCDIVHLPLDLTSFSSIAEAAATPTAVASDVRQ